MLSSKITSSFLVSSVASKGGGKVFLDLNIDRIVFYKLIKSTNKFQQTLQFVTQINSFSS